MLHDSRHERECPVRNKIYNRDKNEWRVAKGTNIRLSTLKSCGFNVRGIVCDNHSSNVSAYKMLLEGCNQDPDSLFMLYESQKIYLFFDTVHLIKSIRNNLLNYRRFLFPSFSFNDFKDPINFQGGELSWKTFHEVKQRCIT